MSKVEQYTQQAINIANDNRHGYSQYNRWGNPDYDCSGLVITVVQNAGIPVKTKGATYTGNMYKPFLLSGFRDITPSVNLRTGAGLKRGDILLTPSSHVEIYIGNGRNVGARISERGTIHGKAGDQTGQEIRTHSYYNKPWKYVLRYNESFPQTNKQVVENYITATAKEVLAGKYGNGEQRKNNLYKAVQDEVNRLIMGKPVHNNHLTTFAKEVLNGKYGNGEDRKNRIYKTVQNQVNKLLRWLYEG